MTMLVLGACRLENFILKESKMSHQKEFFSKLSKSSFAVHFNTFFRIGYKSPLKIFFIFFIVCQLVYEHHGSDNVGSRLSHLASLVERGSSNISPYVNIWTSDWSKTPDGSYYSNKAPGPVFLALPLYYLYDLITTIGIEGEINKITIREKSGHLFARIVSILFQTLPFMILGFYFLGRLIRCGYSLRSQLWWTLAFLFGTTASIFMNMYFGHVLALVFILLMLIFMLEQIWLGVGFCFGWALLCDYGIAMFVPALIFWIFFNKNLLKNILQLMAGGFVPGIIWILYHYICFGSPFSLPNKFQNPRYVDVPESGTSLWGVIDFLPKLSTIQKLLWGTERGLLWTQPWILISLIICILSLLKSDLRKISTFILLSFLGVFIMNASFGGWHGGSSSGPRYLIIALPLLSFYVPSLVTNKSLLSLLTRFSIFYSILLFGFIMSTAALASPYGSLLHNISLYFTSPRSPTAPLRLSFFLIGIFGCFMYFNKKIRRQEILC